MGLTIFWRIILAQVSLIVLIIIVNIYTLSQLQELTNLSQEILSLDTACIEEEKRLLRIIIAQMRSVEKYVLFQDKVFSTRSSRVTRLLKRAWEKSRP